MSASPDAGRDPVEVLADDFLARRRAGETVSVEAFAAAHPAHAEPIRALFPALLALEAQVPPDPLAARADVGPYRVEREIGRGGSGVVYVAVDTRLGRRVALKVLSEGPIASPTALARLRREAEAAARVEHPGLCPVYDVGDAGGRAYIAFRFVAGESLARRIRRRRAEQEDAGVRRLDPAERDLVVRVVEEAARALHAAHLAGLVHRDVKPANVMVTPQGDAVVLDFGLAHEVAGDGAPSTTRTAAGAGTPAYMAPEQLLLPTSALDARVDVYGLGATLYEALTLRPPHEAPTISALLDRVAHAEPERARRLARPLSPDLQAVLDVALAKERDDRYATALELADDLARFRRGEAVRARPPGPLGRATRWARRRPAVAASLAAAFLALTAGLVVSIALLRDARHARDAEAHARASARAEGLAAASTEAGRADGMLGLLLAVEALRAADTPETRSALAAALEQSLERRRLPARERPVTALALDATGDLLLEATDDGRVVRHHLPSGAFQELQGPGPSHGAPIRSAGFVPGSGATVIVDAEGRVAAYDASAVQPRLLFEGDAVRSLHLRAGPIGVLALTEDGRLLARDPAGGAPARAFVPAIGSEPPPTVVAARIRADGKGAFAALADARVVVFDAAGAVVEVRDDATQRGFGPVALLEDDLFARCEKDHPVALEKAGAGPFAGAWRIYALAGPPPRPLRGVFTPSSPPPWSARHVRGVVGADGVVTSDSGAWIAFTLDASHDTRVASVVASEDGLRLLSIRAVTPRDLGDETDPDVLRLWTPLGNRIGVLRLGGRRPQAAAFSGDGSTLAVALHEGTVVCATSPEALSGGYLSSQTARLHARAGPILAAGGTRLLRRADDATLVSTALDGSAPRRVLDPEVTHKPTGLDVPVGDGPLVASRWSGRITVLPHDGSPKRTWEEGAPTHRLWWLAGDDRLVLSVGGLEVFYQDERDRFVRVDGGTTRWRTPDGALVAEREGRLASAPSSSVPRAALVALERDHGSVDLCDSEGRVVGTVPGRPMSRVNAAAFSADGRRVLLRWYPEPFDGTLVGQAALHDVSTGTRLAETPMRAPSGGATAALAPDGRTYAVARPEGAVALYDEHGALIRVLAARTGAAAFSIVLDPTGRRITIGHEDGSLEVREMTGPLVLSLPPREGGVYACFTPDSRHLVTYTLRGLTQVWPLESAELLATARRRVTRALSPGERERYARLLGPRDASD